MHRALFFKLFREGCAHRPRFIALALLFFPLRSSSWRLLRSFFFPLPSWPSSSGFIGDDARGRHFSGGSKAAGIF
ncbi:hypothetical protein TSAR_013597 [Trichomalopsis sarcophagae]|uniref:Uncharacterized protein n=1 Tax=Trichomalopsis sarcophagae TaxID=543379 RepID=A0A232FA71_9HYME|nr:hypothetical protein TSAR_013597 [Trichomalopsis sarcophagae]